MSIIKTVYRANVKIYVKNTSSWILSVIWRNKAIFLIYWESFFLHFSNSSSSPPTFFNNLTSEVLKFQTQKQSCCQQLQNGAMLLFQVEKLLSSNRKLKYLTVFPDKLWRKGFLFVAPLEVGENSRPGRYVLLLPLRRLVHRLELSHATIIDLTKNQEIKKFIFHTNDSN